MERKNYLLVGAIFISLGGILYTAERIAERLAIAIRDAGFASAGMSTPGIGMFPGFFDNFFVWFSFFVGLLMLTGGLLKKP